MFRKRRRIEQLSPEMKLAAKMGENFYPNYYTDRGDFKVKQ